MAPRDGLHHLSLLFANLHHLLSLKASVFWYCFSFLTLEFRLFLCAGACFIFVLSVLVCRSTFSLFAGTPINTWYGTKAREAHLLQLRVIAFFQYKLS